MVSTQLHDRSGKHPGFCLHIRNVRDGFYGSGHIVATQDWGKFWFLRSYSDTWKIALRCAAKCYSIAKEQPCSAEVVLASPLACLYRPEDATPANPRRLVSGMAQSVTGEVFNGFQTLVSAMAYAQGTSPNCCGAVRVLRTPRKMKLGRKIKGKTFFGLGGDAPRELTTSKTRPSTSAIRPACPGSTPGRFYTLTPGTRLNYDAEKIVCEKTLFC